MTFLQNPDPEKLRRIGQIKSEPRMHCRLSLGIYDQPHAASTIPFNESSHRYNKAPNFLVFNLRLNESRLNMSFGLIEANLSSLSA